MIPKLYDHGCKFWKIFNLTWFPIKFLGKVTNFERISSKELWTKTFEVAPKDLPWPWIGLIMDEL